jgi:hypothetical protein
MQMLRFHILFKHIDISRCHPRELKLAHGERDAPASKLDLFFGFFQAANKIILISGMECGTSQTSRNQFQSRRTTGLQNVSRRNLSLLSLILSILQTRTPTQRKGGDYGTGDTRCWGQWLKRTRTWTVPHRSPVWTLNPWDGALFGKDVEPTESGALLEEWGSEPWHLQPALTSCSLSASWHPIQCNQLASLSCSQAFLAWSHAFPGMCPLKPWARTCPAFLKPLPLRSFDTTIRKVTAQQ